MCVGRKYGCYFVLCLQDATKDTIGKCKMNCSQIVGFHTLDETDSITLIGKGYDLQDINIKGRCKIKNSEGIVETQIFYLEEDKLKKKKDYNERLENSKIQVGKHPYYNIRLRLRCNYHL